MLSSWQSCGQACCCTAAYRPLQTVLTWHSRCTVEGRSHRQSSVLLLNCSLQLPCPADLFDLSRAWHLVLLWSSNVLSTTTTTSQSHVGWRCIVPYAWPCGSTVLVLLSQVGGLPAPT